MYCTITQIDTFINEENHVHYMQILEICCLPPFLAWIVLIAFINQVPERPIMLSGHFYFIEMMTFLELVWRTRGPLIDFIKSQAAQEKISDLREDGSSHNQQEIQGSEPSAVLSTKVTHSVKAFEPAFLQETIGHTCRSS